MTSVSVSYVLCSLPPIIISIFNVDSLSFINQTFTCISCRLTAVVYLAFIPKTYHSRACRRRSVIIMAGPRLAVDSWSQVVFPAVCDWSMVMSP